MNALRVVRDDFVLPPAVAQRSPLALPVTPRAKSWNIGRKSRRLWVLSAKYTMRTMAFLAVGGIRIILADKLSVGAAHVLPANFIVARSAVHFAGNRLARPHAGGVYLGVALAAGNLAVPRMAHLAQVDVHGLPVARAAQLFVCVAMQAVRIGHTLRIKNISDLMRLMAIHACGQDICFLFPQLSTNDLPVHRFDQRVAFRAGGGNVPAGDRGSGVGVRQDQMWCVASRAVGGHRESLFQQRLAVDALRVVLQNVVLGNGAVALNWSSFAMALAANKRHFQRRHR